MRALPSLRRSRSTLVVLAVLAVTVAGTTRSAEAYLKFGLRVDGRQVALKWAHRPVGYRVAEQSAPGVSPALLGDAVGRAFARWQAVPTASISYRFDGFTGAAPGEEDGLSTIGFADRADLDRVLASTSFLIDVATGELLEADIFFNTAFQWSVVPGGEAGRYDLETIALHEIGHLSGLGHSALGETEITETGRRVIAAESVMFPIAFSPGSIANRTLRADDVAGISDLYPDGPFARRTGSLSGRVVGAGRGLFGAHVVAFNLATQQQVSGFSLSLNGQFSIGGLSPGPHLVRVEPLDDAETESYFDGSSPVALDFRVTFHERLVAVPAGGDSGTIEIAVDPK